LDLWLKPFGENGSKTLTTVELAVAAEKIWQWAATGNLQVEGGTWERREIEEQRGKGQRPFRDSMMTAAVTKNIVAARTSRVGQNETPNEKCPHEGKKMHGFETHARLTLVKDKKKRQENV